MAINIKKGQRVNLSSANNRVSGVIVGLGWDSAAEGSATVDCDLSAIICDLKGKAQDVIYFGKMRSVNDALVYTGDSQTGEGSGDNERIYINFTKIPQDVGRFVISSNIYDAKAKRQHFGMINNAFVRIVNWKTGEEMLRFNLTDNYSGMSGIIVAEIYHTGIGWDFMPLGKAVQEASRLQSIVKLYQ
mgnify:CR=1 FL=1